MADDEGEELPANQVAVAACPLRHDSEESLHCSENDSSDSENSDEFLFIESSHAIQVLSGLHNLRDEGTFCDVTICVDGEEFACHKIVLASFSSYFKAMFAGDLAESKQNKVSINGVESDMIKQLINYAYTSEILITKENVQSLLSAANLLEVLPVRDACCEFMQRNMDASNCLGIHCFAEAHACTDLQENAKRYTLGHFPDVCQQEEFLKLGQTKLNEFISEDKLFVETEEVVFNAVMKWLEHEPDTHSNQFDKVLEHVRLPLLSPYFVHDCVENRDVIVQSRKCRELVEEAKTFHLLLDRRAELRSPRTRPRKTSRKLLYYFNFPEILLRQYF